MMLGFSDKEEGAKLKEIGLYPEAQEFDSEERRLKPAQRNVAGAGVLRPRPWLPRSQQACSSAWSFSVLCPSAGTLNFVTRSVVKRMETLQIWFLCLWFFCLLKHWYSSGNISFFKPAVLTLYPPHHPQDKGLTRPCLKRPFWIWLPPSLLCPRFSWSLVPLLLSTHCCLCPKCFPPPDPPSSRPASTHPLSQGRASLLVQWLRLRLPMQGAWVWFMVREDPTCLEAAEHVCHSRWAGAASSPCSASGEATTKRSLHPSYRAAPMQQQIPSRAKSQKKSGQVSPPLRVFPKWPLHTLPSWVGTTPLALISVCPWIAGFSVSPLVDELMKTLVSWPPQ